MVTRPTGIVDSERLSALVDGELDRAELAGACDSWRADAAMRASWHSYQLIGDVLRSDDLASDAAHDCAFLIGLRARLAMEPVVLAPDHRAEAALEATRELAEPAEDRVRHALFGGDRPVRAPRSAWLMPSAMAAGFALVVGAFTMIRGSTPDGSATTVAAVDRNVEPRAAASSTLPPAVSFASANGPVLRDPRLDRYLEAHKQFSGSSMLGTPSAFLRSATVDSSTR